MNKVFWVRFAQPLSLFWSCGPYKRGHGVSQLKPNETNKKQKSERIKIVILCVLYVLSEIMNYVSHEKQSYWAKRQDRTTSHQ